MLEYTFKGEFHTGMQNDIYRYQNIWIKHPVGQCRIWASHRGGYEKFYLLRYNTRQSVESEQTFWRNMLPLKHQVTFNTLRNIISQKTELFIPVTLMNVIIMKCLLKCTSAIICPFQSNCTLNTSKMADNVLLNSIINVTSTQQLKVKRKRK
jgi:hypothetical protein